MEEKVYSIEDFLNALANPEKMVNDLPNDAETWSRIGNNDSFEELGLSPEELVTFLEEWRNNNDYASL